MPDCDGKQSITVDHLCRDSNFGQFRMAKKCDFTRIASSAGSGFSPGVGRLDTFHVLCGHGLLVQVWPLDTRQVDFQDGRSNQIIRQLFCNQREKTQPSCGDTATRCSYPMISHDIPCSTHIPIKKFPDISMILPFHEGEIP